MKRRSFLLRASGLFAMTLPFSNVLAQTFKGNLGRFNMITHPAETRGFANHGWLESHHTFSFADYYEPSRMGFGALRVINDDFIAGGMGFGMHPHRDMEIITIPLQGQLQHKDSEGNSSVIKKGEVQIMSAGTGIFHSEHNADKANPVKLLQIWVLPKKMSVKPRYEQKVFSEDERKNKFQIVVAPDGREGSVSINQDAYFSLAAIDQGKEVVYTKKDPNNWAYVFIINGDGKVEGQEFKTRDGIGLKKFDTLTFKTTTNAEILIMEVPA